MDFNSSGESEPRNALIPRSDNAKLMDFVKLSGVVDSSRRSGRNQYTLNGRPTFTLIATLIVPGLRS